MKLSKGPLVVSYYTEGTPYEKEAKDLIASCEKFGLEYEVVGVPSRGSWSANCCYKPEYLLAKLDEHKRPLIWTDVDSVFVQNPEIFYNCGADVALRINDHLPIENKAKILTGTFFINNTASGRKLLQLWKKECERLLVKEEMVFDQVCLRKVILHYPTIVEIKRLPATYVTIVDHPEDKKSLGGDAVVVHYQASRLYQKMVDEEVTPALASHFSSEELKKIRTE